MAQSNKNIKMNFSFEQISSQIDRSVKQQLLREQKKNARELQRVTSTWRNPLQLEIEDTDEGATISTDDQRYQWVDEGTKPHEIRPKNGRVLRFLPGNRVRAEIARRQMNAARRDANAVFVKQVSHPGIRPRSITERVMAKRRIPIISAVEDAVEKAINQ